MKIDLPSQLDHLSLQTRNLTRTDLSQLWAESLGQNDPADYLANQLIPFSPSGTSFDSVHAFSQQMLAASYVVFDRSEGTLTVYPGDHHADTAPTTFPAGNNTTNPAGDPYAIGSNGSAPNGTYPVQRPIATGTSESFGPYFFPVGDCGTSSTCSGPNAGDIARQRGIGIHAGQKGPESRTHGCIRLSEENIQTLHEMDATDPLETITIQD